MKYRTAAFFVFFSFLASMVAYSQNSVPVSPQTTPISNKSESMNRITEDGLYLDFRGATLLNVLTILSDLTGINYVVGKEIANREIHMVLDNATLDEALEAISKGSNVIYDFLSSKRIYLFRATSEPENQPPLYTRVFKLYYINVTPVKQIELEIETGGGGGGGGDQGPFAGYEGEERSDDTKFFEIIENTLSERGSFEVDDRSNSLVVTDLEDRLRKIEHIVAELDRPLDQVLIHVILIETLEDFDRYLGIEWNSTGNQGRFGIITGGSQTTRFPFNLEGPEFLGRDEWFNAENVTETNATTLGTKNFQDLTIQLKALQQAQKIKVIAKPSILVLDNHPSMIAIARAEVIGEATVVTQVGESTGQSVQQPERAITGTMLRVTPLIHPNGKITLTVEPRFVTTTSSAITLSFSTSDPVFRYAKTTMMVNDAQTVVLGGLLDSQQTVIKKKVPVVGDIPVLGQLFKFERTEIQDKELMLFVTPQIVNDPAQLEPVTIPDSRLEMSDENAPFWQVRRKRWFNEMFPKESFGPEDPNMENRHQLMDEAVQTLLNHDGDAVAIRVS